MNNDDILTLKIKNIRKKISSNAKYYDISNDIEQLLIFIEKNYKDIDLFKNIDYIINSFSIKQVIENKEYLESFYKKILNYYFSLLNIDSLSFLSLIFSIILKNYDYINLFEITKIILRYLLRNYIIEFPIDEKEEIYDTFKNIIDNQINILKNSSSYTLFQNSLIRNKIILYLYEYYKKNKRLNIFFKFAGIGIEPLIFSYTMRILYEIEYNKELKNLNIYCYDENIDLLKYFLNNTIFFDNIFLKLKEDICKENDFKIKNLNTNLKLAKKDLIIKEKIDISDNIDFIIINNFLISRNRESLEKEVSLFDEGKIIIEKEECIEIDKKFLYDTKSNFLLELASFFDNKKNKFINFLLLEKITKSNNREDDVEDNEDINRIFYNYKKYSIKELKNKLNRITIKEKNDYLKYAFLLKETGLHSKAFEIIKKYYDSDYNLSYKILKDISLYTKNQKLKTSVEQFIKDYKIIEHGFAAELIDAINDEIEDYFESKKYPNLKDEDYL